MSVFFPEAVSSLGTNTLIWVPAVANKAAATVAEVTATGSVVLQNAVTNSFSPTAEQGTSQDIRMGSLFSYEVPGRATWSAGDALTFIDRPQTTTGDASIKHKETVTEGAVGFLLNRRGLGAAVENWVAPAAGQKYELYPVKAGPQVPVGTDASDEAGRFQYSQRFFITGPVVHGAIAA